MKILTTILLVTILAIPVFAEDSLNEKSKIGPPPGIYKITAKNGLVQIPFELYRGDDGIYEITIELKRGSYDYQYVTADIIDGYIENMNWLELEGNYWETNNEYYIFLFYNEPADGGYEKIIGFTKIISEGL